MENSILILTLLSLIIWIVLLMFRGQFWQADQRLLEVQKPLLNYPSVAIIVPARNEAELIKISLRSLLKQNYPGSFSIILVDDQSHDGTANIAEKTAQILNKTDQLKIIPSQPLPGGWTGKLWAMEQGVKYTQQLINPPDYILFTDADIEHSPNNLKQLVEKAETEQLQLVSLMVLLRCQSFWEKLLIPPFVFFFQKLYPFRWVNHPQSQLAAAAGGCILICREALTRIGGLQILKQALIDDCSLAQAVKLIPLTHLDEENFSPLNQEFSIKSFIFPFTSKAYYPIWLGLTETTQSLRPYPSLSSIWDMVARTAFSQLNFSIILLGLTLIGMILIYLMFPVGLIGGILHENGLIILVATLTGLLMEIAYYPTLKLYRLSPVWGLTLPFIGFLYALMTLDSALKYWRGKGGSWKGRTYP
ncbi:Glycosyl transferase, family 2 [Planktothrix tepida]|uniref:Glycosyl transferase, family 2 n=1 Tax=Planktothrix tepida PCC 9214 TaxID=671072 RepID=A0A1J1LTV4_9CYAN|nr:glycosyltransferase [Planktothrix tepida]CAD5982584.1 Glycosyl transferase, family 2 [Planktothrix tepida]CUR35823.1 Glycosyl transferase, family 2 [Planktothrix tepida PCC 9214]